MRYRFLLAALLGAAIVGITILLLSAHTLTNEPRRRVVLIQVDAMRADFLDRFLADGTLPSDGGFATLSKTFKATFQTVVTPLMTTPNLTTMVTGVYPQRHGAVAKIYPLTNAAVTSWVWAHQQPLGVEQLYRYRSIDRRNDSSVC